mgnify:CR=1 FL=1
MKMYRLVYTDGTHGAWTSNYNRIKALADFFRAEIETMERA